MSVHSSSASWSARDVRPADIIDLDKFMRGGVRPSRPETRLHCDQLVVDAGGACRKPAAATVVVDASTSGSSVCPAKPHAKRFSHDSGLSDGSYKRRKHRPHRRPAIGEHGIRNHELTAARTPANRGSSHSFRAFRTVCERALLDQQQQIARVAELCERLTERRIDSRRERTSTDGTDSSDVTSSSQSTKDVRRKDKHRIDECKTYKIIMTKLDELNRLFAARAQATRPHAASPAPALRRAPPSSGSVSVSDKLVSTEPDLNSQNVQTVHRCEMHVAQRAHSCKVQQAPVRGAHLRAVTNTCDLDIAPCDALPNRTRPNVATESVVQHSGGGSGTSVCDAQCRFDLEDPIHLYSQAKRLHLQAMSATTRRARSVDLHADRLANKLANTFEDTLGERLGERRQAKPRERETTLCSLCRGYWRTLRHYVTAQVFGCQ